MADQSNPTSGGEFAFAVEWALFVEHLRSVDPDAAEYVANGQHPQKNLGSIYDCAIRLHAAGWRPGDRLTVAGLFVLAETPQGADYWWAINDRMGERKYEH